MKHDLIRFMLPLLWMLPLASAQAPAPQQASLPVGKVTIAAMKGAVSFKAAGADIPAGPGQVLVPGTVIETAKGSAVLNLQDGSQVQVKSNSRVVLQDPLEDKHLSLELFLGKMLAKIQKKTGSTPSFRMGTPTAVITVRGTEFEVGVNKKGRTEVYVYQGLVEVIGFATGGRPVLLRPGFTTNVNPNAAPENPREFGPTMRQEREGPDDSMRSRGYAGQDSTDRRQTQQPGQQPGQDSGTERDH